MSFEKEIGKLMQNDVFEDKVSLAISEVMKELLNEKNPLNKSELSMKEICVFVPGASYANVLGLQYEKMFYDNFVRAKIPLQRKRVRELIEMMRGQQEQEKKTLWQKLWQRKE